MLHRRGITKKMSKKNFHCENEMDLLWTLLTKNKKKQSHLWKAEHNWTHDFNRLYLPKTFAHWIGLEHQQNSVSSTNQLHEIVFFSVVFFYCFFFRFIIFFFRSSSHWNLFCRLLCKKKIKYNTTFTSPHFQHNETNERTHENDFEHAWILTVSGERQLPSVFMSLRLLLSIFLKFVSLNGMSTLPNEWVFIVYLDQGSWAV